MKVAVIQPSYIPWKGFFDIINDVDIFVHLDCVQYTKSDWRNRNKIKTSNGLIWLTIPVKLSNDFPKIKDVKIDNSQNWKKKHKESIRRAYSKSPYFKDYSWLLNEIYDKDFESLSDFNIYVTELIAKILSIETKFCRSSNFNLNGFKDDRLIEIMSIVNGNIYISGPSAKAYLDIERWEELNLEVIFKEYQYPSYHQRWGGFDHNVSILDLIFNEGPFASDYIWGKDE